jgi:hypothetical protein
LRLFLSDTLLPQGSQLYVYAASGEVHGPYEFDSGFPAEGFWTHTVFADEIYIEIQLGKTPPDAERAEGFRLVVSRLAHIERLGSPTRPQAVDGTSCLVDATCVSSSDFASIDAATKAVAQLLFQTGGSFYLCSGALVNTTTSSFVPYLLTAHHCFSDQAAASSLQATWRFKTSACSGAFPPENQFSSSLGATLLATSAVSDFTLIRLNQGPPAGSYYMGWSTTDYSASSGVTTYRISHPAPSGVAWPQSYTSHSTLGSPNTCTVLPQGNFIYSTAVVGGTAEGSSGSPVYLSDGRIVGQLFGFCGTDLTNPCDPPANRTVDGSFRATYSSVAQWLNPSVSGSPCVANSTTLCLSNNRFSATANWTTSTASGAGTAVALTSDTGYFWFFSSTNVEAVVKVVNGCSFNSRYWAFAGGLTNVAVTITVADTQTGAVKTYTNPAGAAFQPIQDTAAFATCP